MPSPQRTTVEIFIEILTACETPIGPTKLIYRANVNYIPLRKYIDYLIHRGLLERVEAVKLSEDWRAKTDKRTKYQLQTTMKGKRVLALTRSSEVGLLFGYAKWVEEEG